MAKKVGLVLGAGGAKGLAHIGVLQILQQENIPVDLIAGSSMGAIIGAAYAVGTDLGFLAKLAGNLHHSLFMDVNIPRVGLLKGDKALEIIRLLTHHKSFAELRIPLAVVATDLERGESVVFKSGDLAKSLRASMSIPGIFNPVRFQGRLLVDGAVSERLPVGVAREMGADFIIGVDVKVCNQNNPERVKIRNIYDVIMQSIEIMENTASRQCLEQVDVLITPNVSGIGTNDFHRAQECIELGRLAALERITDIKKFLGMPGPEYISEGKRQVL